MMNKKDDFDYEYFEGCDEKLKSDLFDLVGQHGDMFQEPSGLPPKRGIQHEIQLQQEVPLLKIGMYCMLIMESSEIKKKIQEQRYHTPIYFAMCFTNCFVTKEG